MVSDLGQRINRLACWMSESKHLVAFTGAGISTESGLPDFRGPDGIWTRQAKGLPPKTRDFSSVEPNVGHMTIVELQRLGKLGFLISQNVDNLHLRSGISLDLLAELHGNITVLDLRQDHRNINPEVELLALSVIYNGVISQKPDEHNSWKPEYFVSRFVADCARKNGYDGILFSSVSRYVGENLVVFPSKISIFTIEGECSSFYQEEETSKSTFNSGTSSFHINLLDEPFDKG